MLTYIICFDGQSSILHVKHFQDTQILTLKECLFSNSNGKPLKWHVTVITAMYLREKKSCYNHDLYFFVSSFAKCS